MSIVKFKKYNAILITALMTSTLFYREEANASTIGIGRFVTQEVMSMTPLGFAPWQQAKRTCSGLITPLYADATIDTAFKEMMWKGDNDPITLSFLKTFLPDIHPQSVQKLKTAPTAIPALRERRKKQTFMDFHVTSEDGHHYIVEMQSQRHVRFDERALFYACYTHSHQLEDAHFKDDLWYRHLKPTIAIQIVDFDTNRARGLTIDATDAQGHAVKVVDPDDEDLINRVKKNPLKKGQGEKHFFMTDKHSGQLLDHLQMLQIELPRFNIKPLPEEGKTDTDKEWWIRVLRYSDQYREDDMKQLKDRMPAFFTTALDRLDFKKWNPELIQEYKDSVVDRTNYSTVMQIERAEGKAEGLAEGELKGIKEGELKKAMDVAIKMILKGKTNDEILDVIEELTPDKIDHLRQTMNNEQEKKTRTR